MARFIKGGMVSELKPGEMKLVEEGDLRIILANISGKFVALNDTCPHSEGPLSEGMLEGEEVECPWHGSRFNVMTGEVVQGPAEESVAIYGVRIEGQDILIGPI